MLPSPVIFIVLLYVDMLSTPRTVKLFRLKFNYFKEKATAPNKSQKAIDVNFRHRSRISTLSDDIIKPIRARDARERVLWYMCATEATDRGEVLIFIKCTLIIRLSGIFDHMFIQRHFIAGKQYDHIWTWCGVYALCSSLLSVNYLCILK